MKRNLGFLLVGLFLAACMTAQEPLAERELEVAKLTLSEVYGSPPKVAVVLEVSSVACEQVEVQQRLVDKTFRLKVIGFRTDARDAECMEAAQEHTETVILEGLFESGAYNVVAGDERATFTVPPDYEPETVEAGIDSVDVVVRESNPLGVVAYVSSFYGGCYNFYKSVSQRREGDTFFVAVLVLAPEPPEVLPCPPTVEPFTERVELETQNLPPGVYKVDINGVVKTFILP